MAALHIALKDIRQRLRDRSFYLWGIAAPLGLAAIFSLLFGGIASGTMSFSFAIADGDGQPRAREFVQQVLALAGEGLAVEEVASAAEAGALVEDGEKDAVFVIPAGFSSAVESPFGEPVIEVLANVDSPIAGQVARSIAGRFAAQLEAVRVSLGTYYALGGPQPAPGEEGALAQEALGLQPVELAETPLASKDLSTKTFFAAGMAILFIFLTVQFGVLGLLEERQNGTMGRLLAAPISRRSIVVGKALTSFILGVVSMAVLVVGSTLLLGAEWGNSWGVAILVLAAVIAAMGVMFVVAAFARTPEQAGNLQSIIAFVLAMLGGCFFPIAQAGGLLETLSLTTPHAWFLRALGDLAAGGGVGAVFPAALYIAAFGVVTGGLAQLRIGKVLTP